MPDRPPKKPPPDDPNKAAKAVVDRVATLTEEKGTPSNPEKVAPDTETTDTD